MEANEDAKWATEVQPSTSPSVSSRSTKTSARSQSQSGALSARGNDPTTTEEGVNDGINDGSADGIADGIADGAAQVEVGKALPSTKEILQSPRDSGINMNEMHNNIASSLQSTFDISRLVNAFDNLFQVINEQNTKMSTMKAKMNGLRDDQNNTHQQTVALANALDRVRNEEIPGLQKALSESEERQHRLEDQLKQQELKHSEADAQRTALEDDLLQRLEDMQYQLAHSNKHLHDLQVNMENLQHNLNKTLENPPPAAPVIPPHILELFNASGAAPKVKEFRQSIVHTDSYSGQSSRRSSPAVSRRNSGRQSERALTPSHLRQPSPLPVTSSKEVESLRSFTPNNVSARAPSPGIVPVVTTNTATEPLVLEVEQPISARAQSAGPQSVGGLSSPIREEEPDDLSVTSADSAGRSSSFKIKTPIIDDDVSLGEESVGGDIDPPDVVISNDVSSVEHVVENVTAERFSRPPSEAMKSVDLDPPLSDVALALKSSRPGTSTDEVAPTNEELPAAIASRGLTPAGVAMESANESIIAPGSRAPSVPPPVTEPTAPEVREDVVEKAVPSSKPPSGRRSRSGSITQPPTQSSTTHASKGSSHHHHHDRAARNSLTNSRSESPMSFLSPEQRFRITQELKLRGEFIMAAKEFQTHSTAPPHSDLHHAPHSDAISSAMHDALAHRADQLQDHLARAMQRLDSLEQQLKQEAFMRQNQKDQVVMPVHHAPSLPYHFQAHWEELNHLRERIAAHGGIERVFEVVNMIDGNSPSIFDELEGGSSKLASKVPSRARTPLEDKDKIPEEPEEPAEITAQEEKTEEPPQPEPVEQPPAEENKEEKDSGESNSPVPVPGSGQLSARSVEDASHADIHVLRTRQMSNTIQELRQQFQQKHADITEKHIKSLAEVSRIDSSQFAPVRSVLELKKEVDTLKLALQQLSKSAYSRMDVTNMLSIPSDGRIPIDPSAVRFRAAVLAVIQGLRGGMLTEEESESLLNCVSTYTDTPLKQQVHDMAEKIDSVLAEAYAQVSKQHQVESELRDFKHRFATFEDGVLLRFDAVHQKIAKDSAMSAQSLVNGDAASAEIMQFLSSSVREVKEEQHEVIVNLTKQLTTLQKEVEVKPSNETVENMVKLIESTFKRRLGENVVGLKLTVGQVLRAVQQKANKEEVMAIITNRMEAMEEAMNEIVHDEVGLAGSVRCISCGNRYQPSSGAGLIHAHPLPDTNPSPQPHGLMHGNLQHRGSSAGSIGSLASAASLGSGQSLMEQMQAQELMAARSGLRSLLPQENPQLAKTGNPYRTSKAVVVAPEPLYRKAKLANAMREMVKTPQASVLQSTYAGQLLHLDDDGSIGDASATSSHGGGRSLGSAFKQKYHDKVSKAELGIVASSSLPNIEAKAGGPSTSIDDDVSLQSVSTAGSRVGGRR